jgi:hypothetical protein
VIRDRRRVAGWQLDQPSFDQDEDVWEDRAMEVIRLDEGDPAWLFGDTQDVPAVRQILRQAAEEVLFIAADVGGRVGWTGAGLEFHRLPGAAEVTARTQLAGFVEVGEDITFWAELSRVADGFAVEAEITVRCDAEIDCGTHTVEAMTWPVEQSPHEAATDLLESSRWLRRQANAHPLSYWRQHDPRKGHI